MRHYLHQGSSLIVIDVVTNRRANLHNEIISIIDGGAAFQLPDDVHLYAVAYRPVRRQDRAEIDIWPATIAVGGPLPVMPLRLTGNLFVPVDFETTYQGGLPPSPACLMGTIRPVSFGCGMRSDLRICVAGCVATRTHPIDGDVSHMFAKGSANRDRVRQRQEVILRQRRHARTGLRILPEERSRQRIR
jgi:hypothetical protein